ncbi:MAG TPA: general stress protein [Candidatus Saccharimonadales bacterium]|nr:general stress protein [Candidatus Saccharimonadales bacterium]
MAKMVFGIFQQRENAESAINELESEGFKTKDISIMMNDREDAKVIADNTGASVGNGAASGAATGAVLGGLAGLLVGMGAIAIPGLGALLIGGPLATALGLTGTAAATASGAATGLLAGGLIGALVNLGVPESDARVYEQSIKSGAILVAVPARLGEHREASAVLRENGAEQVKTIDMNDTDKRQEMHATASM